MVSRWGGGENGRVIFSVSEEAAKATCRAGHRPRLAQSPSTHGKGCQGCGQPCWQEGAVVGMAHLETGAGGKGMGRGKANWVSSFCPFLLDGQVPLPGEMVMLVIIREEGFVVIGASSQHTLRSLFNRCQELILLWPWPVAANHECGFVH